MPNHDIVQYQFPPLPDIPQLPAGDARVTANSSLLEALRSSGIEPEIDTNAVSSRVTTFGNSLKAFP